VAAGIGDIELFRAIVEAGSISPGAADAGLFRTVTPKYLAPAGAGFKWRNR
jgi:hypothetical protein